MDAFSFFTDQLGSDLRLTGTFNSPGFYMELVIIVLSIALAWLITLLVQRRAEFYMRNHSPRFLTSTGIIGILSLLSPLLALAYLYIGYSVFEAHTSGIWIKAASKLCLAYLIAKAAVLAIGRKAIGYFIAGIIMVVAALDVTGLMAPLTRYLDGIAIEIGKFHISIYNLVQGGVILVIVFWLAKVVSASLENYLRHSSSLSYNARELIVKFFKLFIYFLALMITLSALGVDLTAFAVFGGALGVGIGLGLQKITANFISGITLLAEKSIKLGDLIEVGDVSGWVRQLNVRYTLVETFDGREMMIPNEELTSTRVTNWTFSNNRARVEIHVGVAYGSDVKLVKKLLTEAAESHPACLRDPEVKCWLREFGDHALKFLLVFWIADIKDGRYGPQSDVMCSILEKFRANNIEIPFPQQVVHARGEDGSLTSYLVPERP